MNKEIIKISDLHFRIGRTEILKGINLSVQAGEFMALVGPNGAGKTTLLRHINGLRKPSAGTVIVNDQDTRRARTSELARTVGFLFQNPDHQIISNHLEDEIRFGLKHTGVPHSQWEERIREAAESVELSHMLDSDPFTLSRSMRQRVALASVLALRPGILVLDEPTSAQDEKSATKIMETAQRLNCDGVTVILVSHDMELVSRYATRAVVLVEGRMISDSPVHDLFRNDKIMEHAGLSKPGAYRISDALGLKIEPGSPATADTLVSALKLALSGVKA